MTLAISEVGVSGACGRRRSCDSVGSEIAEPVTRDAFAGRAAGHREAKLEEVRVGIIGAGKVAQDRNIPRLKNVSGVRVTHAWSRTPETARGAAARFDIPVVVGDWREIVDSPDIDAVVVATPPVLHLPATLAALDAGKHVLCQARMARNLAEARRMCEAALRHGPGHCALSADAGPEGRPDGEAAGAARGVRRRGYRGARHGDGDAGGRAPALAERPGGRGCEHDDPRAYWPRSRTGGLGQRRRSPQQPDPTREVARCPTR